MKSLTLILNSFPTPHIVTKIRSARLPSIPTDLKFLAIWIFTFSISYVLYIADFEGALEDMAGGAKIVTVSGSVKYRQEDRSFWRNAIRQKTIPDRSYLITGKDGSTEIFMPPSNLLKIGPNSLAFLSFGIPGARTMASIALEKGTLETSRLSVETESMPAPRKIAFWILTKGNSILSIFDSKALRPFDLSIEAGGKKILLNSVLNSLKLGKTHFESDLQMEVTRGLAAGIKSIVMPKNSENQLTDTGEIELRFPAAATQYLVPKTSLVQSNIQLPVEVLRLPTLSLKPDEATALRLRILENTTEHEVLYLLPDVNSYRGDIPLKNVFIEDFTTETMSRIEWDIGKIKLRNLFPQKDKNETQLLKKDQVQSFSKITKTAVTEFLGSSTFFKDPVQIDLSAVLASTGQKNEFFKVTASPVLKESVTIFRKEGGEAVLLNLSASRALRYNIVDTNSNLDGIWFVKGGKIVAGVGSELFHKNPHLEKIFGSEIIYEGKYGDLVTVENAKIADTVTNDNSNSINNYSLVTEVGVTKVSRTKLQKTLSTSKPEAKILGIFKSGAKILKFESYNGLSIEWLSK